MFKWVAEIKAVGFKDWLWFVFYLRRNEFSHKLTLINRYLKYVESGCRDTDGSFTVWWSKLTKDRSKAHDIDEKLSSL